MNLKFNTSKEQIENIVYSSDASGLYGNAKDVMFPESIEELQQIIRQNNNIVPRGGGSGLAGGAVPLGSVVIDLSKLNKILKIDSEKRAAYVEAGIILDKLNDELEKYNLEFPVQPSSHAICTIGGMIATNAAGSRAIKYGKTSNWINEIEIVNGQGEVVKINKLDLKDFAGMEGITGIIARAKLKLIEKPVRTASLLQAESMEKIIDAVKKLKLNSDISMIEFFDKKVSQMIGLEYAYHLLIEFESGRGEFKQDKYQEIISLRDRVYPALAGLGFTHIEDPKLFIDKIKDFIQYAEQNNIPVFAHMGSGIMHACFNTEQQEEDLPRKTLVFARKLHGSVSGEHGIGLAKKEFVEPSDKRIFKRIKERYDSLNKFNLNKIIDYEKGEQVEKSIESEPKEQKEIENPEEAEKHEELEHINGANDSENQDIENTKNKDNKINIEELENGN